MSAYGVDASPNRTAEGAVPGRYARDGRVEPHPDGTWMVFRGGVEFNVAQRRRPGSMDLVPDLWWASDGDGWPVREIPDGPFDQVVHALIGDPR